MKKKATGAVFSALVTRDFEIEKVFEPSLIEANKYEKNISLIFLKILNNTIEIEKLEVLKNNILSQLSH